MRAPQRALLASAWALTAVGAVNSPAPPPHTHVHTLRTPPQKETCDTYCTQECTKAYANVTEVALTDAASGNKTDACIKACGPCCKARSVFTGAEGWEATCSLQGAKVPQCDKFREDYGEVYDAGVCARAAACGGRAGTERVHAAPGWLRARAHSPAIQGL